MQTIRSCWNRGWARSRVVAAAVLMVALCTAASAAGADSHGGGEAMQDPAERGRQLYDQLCWTCHGRYGRGDGPVARDLSRRPPDFTRPALLAGRSDEQVVAALREASGKRRHTPMAVSEVVNPDSLRDAVAFMRTLAVPGEHVSVRAGRDLYGSFCWFCHGENGDGMGPAAANLPDPKPRNFRSEQFVVKGREKELAEIIRGGAAATMHGSEYMLEWGTKLSDQQIWDLVAYIGTFKR